MKPEEIVQTAIVDYLRATGIFVHSVSNEGAYGNIPRMMKLKRMGLFTGCADLIAWLPGGITYLEVKARRGYQTDHQKGFESECHRYGIKYAVVRSIDDVQRLLGGENGRPEKAI